ncbi:hypothetical protein TWF730_003631 [Orbilia blumenaviensis]|uniref:BTB domain-containing protein n=1 Tax=Orbilia blumenaviensis TaxID=1796055 RepID=A0AAV9U2Y0_9PEZI
MPNNGASRDSTPISSRTRCQKANYSSCSSPDPISSRTRRIKSNYKEQPPSDGFVTPPSSGYNPSSSSENPESVADPERTPDLPPSPKRVPSPGSTPEREVKVKRRRLVVESSPEFSGDELAPLLTSKEPSPEPQASHEESIENTNSAQANEQKDIAPRSIDFTQILDDSAFSDITVYIGPRRQPFRLHRNFICHTSDYFRTACKDLKITKFTIAKMSPEVFKVITRWQYGGGIRELPFYGNFVYSVFRGADGLGIPHLKFDILQNLAYFCRVGICLLEKLEKEHFFTFFMKICKLSSIQELQMLTICAETVVLHWRLGQPFFLYGDGELRPNDMFRTAYIGAMQNLGGQTVCQRCNRGQSLDSGLYAFELRRSGSSDLDICVT